MQSKAPHRNHRRQQSLGIWIIAGFRCAIANRGICVYLYDDTNGKAIVFRAGAAEGRNVGLQVKKRQYGLTGNSVRNAGLAAK